MVLGSVVQQDLANVIIPMIAEAKTWSASSISAKIGGCMETTPRPFRGSFRTKLGPITQVACMMLPLCKCHPMPSLTQAVFSTTGLRLATCRIPLSMMWVFSEVRTIMEHLDPATFLSGCRTREQSLKWCFFECQDNDPIPLLSSGTTIIFSNNAVAKELPIVTHIMHPTN